MFFSIVVALMVILVTAFWVYQGFFSSVIMLLETLVSALVAFAFYEDLNALWQEQLGPGVGHALALMAILLVVLFVLRLATDRLIPSAVNFPLYLDRAGGGVCGFFTAMLLIGTPLIAIQMLPIGSAVFYFERYTADKETGKIEEDGLSFLSPDEFTAGLVSMLSKGRFGGENPFYVAKPDLIRDLYGARATPRSEARVFLPSDALKVNAHWEARAIDLPRHVDEGGKLSRRFETVEPERPGHKFLVCNVNVDAKAADEKSDGIRFRVPQFRIVGPPPAPEGQPSKTPQVYLAFGMTDLYTHQHLGPNQVTPGQVARLVKFDPTTDFILAPAESRPVARFAGDAARDYTFDVVFEVPETFEPWYVEFKRGARADLTRKKMSKEPPSFASQALGDKGESGVVKATATVGQAPGGRTHIANAIEERTGASDKLPVTLSVADPMAARHLAGQKLRGGHFHIRVPSEPPPEGAEVTEFLVPDEKRMVQVGAHDIKAESLVGQAINFANRVTAQVRVKDEEGQVYFAIGQYAAAEVDGEAWIEIQYYPEAEVPERCLQKPQKVTDKILQRVGAENYKFGFLFLVDPGVKIVSFHPGPTKSQDMNIKVPD